MMRNTMLSLFLIFALNAQAQEFLSSHKNMVDEQGRKQGEWVVYDESGILKYTGQFRDGVPYGTFKYYYPGRKIKAISEFSQNGKVTHTTLFHKNGFKMAAGKYVDQKRDSVWNLYSQWDENLLIAKEFYENTIREGVWLKYYADGSVAEETTYKNDRKNGPWVQYFTDGQVHRKSTYKNGKLNGLMTVYFPSGEVAASGTYKNGLKDGIWMYFNKEGQNTEKEVYSNGHLMEHEVFIEEEE
ncbi:MAG: toxin-antitoxin system YwqK family antitoxin [Bacteroidales bacterium]|nr:toxin-antitoxin system YwqK family antitoxin [Bacteroidales bacterium]MCF8387864.1 toxin-antitoxin system YwqK family antitoxin [Bacteroidales bacterium]MCF8399182.1 toxin-antitoxin system YwqK family antitoxin [Bacteroidales bacterium]